jgi:hypothetical protein
VGFTVQIGVAVFLIKYTFRMAENIKTVINFANCIADLIIKMAG